MLRSTSAPCRRSLAALKAPKRAACVRVLRVLCDAPQLAGVREWAIDGLHALPTSPMHLTLVRLRWVWIALRCWNGRQR